MACFLLGSCAVVPNKTAEPSVVKPQVNCAEQANTAYPRSVQTITIAPAEMTFPIECKLDGIIKCSVTEEKTIPAVKVQKDVNMVDRQTYAASCQKLQK